MRRYISFILLVVIVFVSTGYHIYFKYLQNNIRKEIKHEIRKGLDKKDLSLIIISSKNKKYLTWIEENKEFNYKGAMYDVVKIETKNSKTYYYCINDIKENDLIVNYTRHNRRRSKTILKLRKVLTNKYFPEKYSISIPFSKADVYYSDNLQIYISIYIETFSPPPQV